MSASGPLESAIAALKTGRPVRIESGDPITILSVETADDAILGLLDPEAAAPLLISGRRAAALSLGNRREAADPHEPVLVERSAWLSPGTALDIVDPGKDSSRPPLGPLVPTALDRPAEAAAALKLARLAGL